MAARRSPLVAAATTSPVPPIVSVPVPSRPTMKLPLAAVCESRPPVMVTLPVLSGFLPAKNDPAAAVAESAMVRVPVEPLMSAMLRSNCTVRSALPLRARVPVPKLPTAM